MKKPWFKKRLALLYGSLLCLLLVLVLWIVWGNTALTVHCIPVSGSQIPPEFSGFRIAQVSDLHNAEFGAGNAKLLRALSDARPDIVVITGDLVDARHPNPAVALDFVREAAQIAPVYYVTGNHEARLAHYGALKTGLEAAGAVVLEDAAVPLERGGATVTLIGLSDPDFAGKGDLFHEVPAMTAAKLHRLIGETPIYTILLSHRPELFETYVQCGVNLALSGHAHGGQFRLPLIGGLVAPNQGLFPKYDAGCFTERDTTMVVSRGLGNSIIPFRVNNRPELVLVELQSEPQ